MKKIIFSALIISVVLFSCKKRNIEEEVLEDSISGRKIRYVVMVLDGSNSVNKSITLDSAKVSLVMNDSIYTKKIDTTGLVHFDYLFAGNTVVKISCENFTTVNYIVDLTAEFDTTEVYDSDNLRVVSSLITIFPTKGENTAKIIGKAFADLDLTAAGLETVPANTRVTARINVKSLEEYISHSAPGGILNFSYENVNADTLIDASGNYEIIIPASLNGLEVIINADDFAYDQQISPTQTQRKIYTLIPDTLNVISGCTKINDLIFE